MFAYSLFLFIRGWTICLKLSPNLRKKAKVYIFSYIDCYLNSLPLLFKIRKGSEISNKYEPEFDKIAKELSRTVADNLMDDILIIQTNDVED